MNASGKKLNLLQKIQLQAMLGAITILRVLGYSGIKRLSAILGQLLWHISASRRNLAINSVQKHLEVSREQATRIAKESFSSCFQSFMEIVLVKSFSLAGNPNLLEPDEKFIAVIKNSRPMVMITAHIGAWELLAGILPEFRPEYPRIVVVRNQKNLAANELIYRMRGAAGGEVVGHRNASGPVLQTLRKNGTTAFLVDHNTSRQEAIFLPFLGEDAAVNFGPALLALRAKALVAPIFLIRQPQNKYKLIVGDALDTAALQGSIAEKSKQIAEFYTKTVEDIIRLYPEQWFWMHRRWKTRPPQSDEGKK